MWIRFHKSLAWIITVLFHPLLLLSYLFTLVVFFNPLQLSSIPENSHLRFLVLVFLTTFGMPFLLVALFLLLFRRGVTFRILMLERSKDRVMPLLIVAIFYSMLVYLIGQRNQFNQWVYMVFIITTILILLTAFISTYWKISAHAVGYAGMLSMLMVIHAQSPHSMLFYPILLLILLGGMLLSARLYLRAHTPWQVYSGMALGFSLGTTLYFVM
ncbi:MAG: hypothetical protein MUF42_12780 [Cytophagaceae bacterium]|jgi:hypothetical protein|nr:hypothetical protein [Cytophagaceae bacterium]